MVNKKNSTEMIIWGLVVIGLIYIFIHSGAVNLGQKFAITDSDYTCDIPVIITFPDASWSIDQTWNSNSTAYGPIMYYSNNLTKHFKTGQTYWELDNDSNTIYNSVPDLEGTHKIYKFTVNLIENDTEISFTKCSALYTKETTPQCTEDLVSSYYCASLGKNLTQTARCVNGSYVYETTAYPCTVPANVTSSQLCKALAGTYTNVTCTCPNGDIWYDNASYSSKVCGSITKTVEKDVQVPPTFFQKYGIALLILIAAVGIIFYMKGGKKK